MAGPEEAVIDASTAIMWISEEEGTQEALVLRDDHVSGITILSAPDLLIYEIANALRYKPDFDDVTVNQAMQSIIDLQINLITLGKELLRQTTRNAFRYDISVYDSCYLALGELLGIKVYTSDKKLYEKAKKSNIIKLI